MNGLRHLLELREVGEVGSDWPDAYVNHLSGRRSGPNGEFDIHDTPDRLTRTRQESHYQRELRRGRERLATSPDDWERLGLYP
jgi:hypothetical protein